MASFQVDKSSSLSWDTKKLQKAHSVIKSKYVHQVNDQQLIDGAIEGMMQSLKDPHSTYMDQKAAQQFESGLSSTFSGIGAEVEMKNGKVTVISPVQGSPAEKAGLRPNDQIVKVNGKSLEGLNLNQAIEKIRGPKGSKVLISVVRTSSESEQQFLIVRDDIKQDTVTSKVLDQNIGYIDLKQFSRNTAADFKKELSQLESKKIQGLVIDVRGNPGGLLDSVEEILQPMVPSNKKIIMIEDKQKNREVVHGKAQKVKPYPVTVLIDNGSASASEILAGALRESAGAKLLGEKSYGKGTVQSTVDFSDGSNIKLTMAKWLTPNGNFIDQKGGTKGLQPDLVVKYPGYMKAAIPEVKKPLKVDSNSSQVKNMQILLLALGEKPGRVDGYFSQQTARALKAFQRKQKIKQTGVLDNNTAESLRTAFVLLINNEKRDVHIQAALKEIKNRK